ncbi:MAG: hypothetical protein ACPIOQ_44855 [Promethearchaeia archaeon]
MGQDKVQRLMHQLVPVVGDTGSKSGLALSRADKGAGTKGSPGSPCPRWSAQLRCENRVRGEQEELACWAVHLANRACDSAGAFRAFEEECAGLFAGV